MHTIKEKQNIPNGWRKTSLGSLTTKLKTGGTPTSTNKSFYGGNIPFVKIDDMTTSGKYLSLTKNFISEDGLKNSSAWLVPEGSILYSIYATIGEVSINSIDVATNQAIMGIVADENKAIRDYLYQYLLSIKPALNKHFKETTQKNLTSQIVRELEILIPKSKTEQQKIAEVLGAVDEDIVKTQEVIEATEKLKKGLMQQFFSSGEQKEIREIAELNPQQINPLNKPNEEFYYIDIASIKENMVTEVKKFFGKEAPSRARRVLAEMDIIISTVRPNLRGFAYITKEYNTFLGSTGFCVLRSHTNKINPKFLYYVISDDRFTDYLVGKTTGSNYPAVNPEDIGDYLCSVPNINEQQKIAEILSVVDEKISVNKKLKEKLTLLKKGLMQDLLSGKVRTNI